MSRSRSFIAPKPQKQKTSIPFSELEEYQQIKKMRAVADALEIRNPYFRMHDQRAGATTVVEGKTFVNFGSYDYLGFNADKRVAKAALDAIDRYGMSSSASRLVGGERPVHLKLEQSLAQHYGVEDAVVFVSGHATNVSVIGELLNEKDLILHDSLVHNSVVVGAKLSGASRRSFMHNDLEALTQILQQSRSQYRRALIVVEGLFSMDGDTPDLPALVEIKERFGAWLMVDEAHSLGTLGITGQGISEHCSVHPKKIDIFMGTLSKTLAASGGYIAGSKALVELLKTHASSYVYSVGLSPPLAASANRALELLHDEPDRVARLQANSRLFLNQAREHGLDVGTGEGFAIAPVLVGDSLKAAKLCERLFERGYNVLPILYPAVPMQSARLRFFITSEHTSDQIKSAVLATREELARLNEENFAEPK